MAVSPFDSKLFRDLFSDPESVSLFDDTAQIKGYLQTEAALARAQGALGIIPKEAADKISSVANSLTINPEDLSTGTQITGVPIPEFVAQLREVIEGDAATYVHWGATSQDIIDTGLILRLKQFTELVEDRVRALKVSLSDQIKKHRHTVMAGRTRTQQSTPILAGLKIAGWLAPFNRHSQRMSELKPRLLCVQFGGASGNMASLGDRGLEVADEMAKLLNLQAPAGPWHGQRDSLVEFAGLLSLISGSLGKIGEDLMLLGQSEVGEMSSGSGGGSSTMPQKSNPIDAEALATLARHNAGLLANVHHALPHASERDGPRWSLEWLNLPQMAVATAAALAIGLRIIENLQVDEARAEKNLESSNGLILAEAASFALSEHMPRAEAQKLVKSAVATSLHDGRHLMSVLVEMTDAPIDWDVVKEPSHYVGAADQIVDRILAETAV